MSANPAQPAKVGSGRQGERFTLDRRRLQAILTDEDHDHPDPASDSDDGATAALRRSVTYAEPAIRCPAGVELQTYQVDHDALLVCVRPCDQREFGLRQVAGYAIEIRHLLGSDRDRGSFDARCETIDALLAHANGLLPALRAVQTGENRSTPADHRLPEVTAYHATDGAVVVEIDTESAGPQLHDHDGVPYLRVYVNDWLIDEHSPPTPLPGSPLAAGSDEPDPDAAIGTLTIGPPTPPTRLDRTPTTQRPA